MVGDLPGAATIIDCDSVDTVSVEDNKSFMSFDRGDTGGGAVVELDHKSKRAQSYPLKKNHHSTPETLSVSCLHFLT